MNPILLKYLFLVMSFTSLVTNAADESPDKLAWVNDFFSKGIKSAKVELFYQINHPKDVSDFYYKSASQIIFLDNDTKDLTINFLYEYQDDWSILTALGTVFPPEQEVLMTGSKIEPWTNINGLGRYRETYYRKIPNWLFFKGLDSLLMQIALIGNPSPALTGIFYPDEFKALKKAYKTAQKSEFENLISCFDFDNSGNVIDFSKQYLNRINADSGLKQKQIMEYTFHIRNSENDLVKLELLSPEEYPHLIEGVIISSGDKKIKIFSFEINRRLNKFVPDLFADPDRLILDYLMAIKEETKGKMTRIDVANK